MRVIYDSFQLQHNPSHELYDGVPVPYAETADRARSILARLQKEASYDIVPPRHFSLAHRRRIHDPLYIRFLRQRSAKIAEDETLHPSYFITDTYAPLTRYTYQAASRAVDVALTAADDVLHGEPLVYGLCRPPGHHAEHRSMGGYCYFNNAAIAAHYLSTHGRVAILDIDVHHGNGTQHCFYNRADVLYVSIHADPTAHYPYASGFAKERGQGRGTGYNRNYPLRLGTGDAEYRRTLRQALHGIATFLPDFLLVSAGFDAHADDPIGGLALSTDGFYRIGQAIAALNVPTVVLQEGGYNVQLLGEITHQFLQGLQKRPPTQRVRTASPS